jgi:hypothetical protein
MTESESRGTSRATKSKRAARITLGIIIAVALIVAIFYWPSTREGLSYLLALIVVVFVGLALLRKWPSI